MTRCDKRQHSFEHEARLLSQSAGSVLVLAQPKQRARQLTEGFSGFALRSVRSGLSFCSLIYAPWMNNAHAFCDTKTASPATRGIIICHCMCKAAWNTPHFPITIWADCNNSPTYNKIKNSSPSLAGNCQIHRRRARWFAQKIQER